MDICAIVNKLTLLFQKFTEPGYVMENYYGDSLINILSSADTDPEIAAIFKCPVVPDLITEILERLEDTHVTVKVFVIRLCSIMMRDELTFAKICLKGKGTFIAAFNDLNSANLKPSLKVAYIELAHALVEHSSGITLLLECEAWKSILKLCNEKQTVFVVRQTYKFTGKFLWQLNDMCDKNDHIINVLKVILEPIIVNDFIEMTSVSTEEEGQLCLTVEPMLHMLLSLFNDSSRICQSTLLINTLVYQYSINTHLYVLMERFHKKEIMFLLSKLIFWTVLAKCFVENPVVDGVCYEKTNLMDLSVAYINVIMRFISRGDATSILDYCNACNVIWAQVWRGKMAPIYENSKGEKILVQQQLIVLQLVPIIVYIKTGMQRVVETEECEYLTQFITKLMDSTSEHTMRCCYSMRSLIMSDCLSVTLQSVKRLSCLKNHLNSEQATILFQTLFYVLKYYDPLSQENEGGTPQEALYEDSEEKVQVMTYVMDNMYLLLKNFNLHWKDSLEVLCLYSVVHSILNHRRNLSCKFVVSSLSVIALTVRKFQPPNLSLLVDTEPGSAIHELGQLVYTKMHDSNWEVRDSALELLLVCTEIAFIKFPPFQKQIVSNQLIVVAATMALNDHEYYVQASALKCLAAATKVHSVWEQLLGEHPDINDKLISIIRHNQEGIVRKEAVNIFSSMYQNIKLQDTFKHTMYDHMISTALTDFHWEAQIAALQFWKVVIQSHLTEQGMLDGTFPPVTFSKETRKIVTLNQQEIQRRLIKALEEISAIGILTVLVKLMQDDVEIAIMEQALSISQDLLDILNQYKVSEVLKPSKQDKESLNEILCMVDDTDDVKNETKEDISEKKSEEIIDGIVNSDDINLLANIYESQMKLQTEDIPRKVIPKIKILKFISPAAFISFLTSKDFKKIIKEKRQWNDGIVSLPSLLEDMLGIYEVNDDDVNTMDCY